METSITLELNNPLTDEQWDAISDVDFDRTKQIWFTTKHGKRVEFMKVIRCKDCKHYTGKWCTKFSTKQFDINDICKADDDFCSQAERKDYETD